MSASLYQSGSLGAGVSTGAFIPSPVGKQRPVQASSMPSIGRWIRASVPGPAWFRQKAWFLPKPPPPAAAGHILVPGCARELSHEIVEVSFGADAAAHPEN